MKNTITHARTLSTEDGPITLDGLAEWVEAAKKAGISGTTEVELPIPARGGIAAVSVSQTVAE